MGSAASSPAPPPSSPARAHTSAAASICKRAARRRVAVADADARAVLVVCPRPNPVWLGPRFSVRASAAASAEACALASASLSAAQAQQHVRLSPTAAATSASPRPSTLAAVNTSTPRTFQTTSSAHHANTPGSEDPSSVLVKEVPMLVLFGKLFHSEIPVMLLKYKGLENDCFVVKFNKPRHSTSTKIRVSPDNSFNTDERHLSGPLPHDLENISRVTVSNRQIRKELQQLKVASIHENITKFLFAAVSAPADPAANSQQPNAKQTKRRRNASDFYVILSECSRGSLEDSLGSLRFPPPDVIKLSLCRDLLVGLQFLHSTFRDMPGLVSSRSCFVTEDWRLKLYPGNFENVAELAETEKSQDPYEVNYLRLFVAPEHITLYPKHKKSFSADVYSAGMLMNMIWNNGEKPFIEHRKKIQDILSQLPNDKETLIRPATPSEINSELLKVIAIIQKCWSFSPAIRPPIKKVLEPIITLLKQHIPNLSTVPIFSSYISLFLTKAHSVALTDYIHELESAQSHMSTNLGEAVTRRLGETEMRMGEYQRQIDQLTSQLFATREHATNQTAYLGLETDGMRLRVMNLEREILASRLGLLPSPLQRRLMDLAAATLAEDGGVAGDRDLKTLDFDTLYKPTVFRDVSVVVVSIAGFNRFVQHLSVNPKALISILRNYHSGIDNAIASIDKGYLPKFGPGAGKIYVMERVLDACVLVAGVPDKNTRHAVDAVDFAVHLLKWALNWDASQFLPGGNSRLFLRIGIHSGHVMGGLIGKTNPKLLLMGGERNGRL
ncbi:hypothetical protein HDU83_006282 [Entophlyctis luteolus]|nr:hypothetical protein HDU83_006282 [Entophlyctis luteolus]